MQIAPSSVVFIAYELSIKQKSQQDDFELVEVVPTNEPMAFIYGMSGLPEAFEEKLLGLNAGDTFDFQLEAEEGYGEFDEEAVVELPLQMFLVDGEIPEGMLEVGHVLPMSDNEGNQLRGLIVEIGAETVTMDFNHPLADKEMHFKGQVLNVRAATESELDHGHVHGDGGVEH
jgi:FKBP-type peptidyl-prolyl cis-trans isomerase SlyD